MSASSWSAVYDSAWHNPGLFWLCGAGFLALLARRPGPFGAWLAAFATVALADCTLTGALSPLPATSTAATVASIVFVILGDLRYFWITESVAHDEPLARRAPRALALSLIVPVASAVVRSVWPALFTSSRVTFLVYELMMVGLVAAHGFWLLRVAAARRPAERSFVGALLGFELAQYGLWASVDVLLRAGINEGYVARIVPNVMYYALFLPFVWWRSRRLA